MEESKDEVEIGLEHHMAGRLSEAESAYRRALALDPNEADALHLLGTIGAQMGQYDSALKMIERAIEIDPSPADFHNNRGLILSAIGRLEEAMGAYRKAISLNAETVEAHCNLGNALLTQGHVDEAIAEYRRTIALKPEHANAHCNLGVALHRQGSSEAAIASYRHALELVPQHAEALSNLGVALRDSGKTEEAISSYRQAIRVKPNYVDAYTNLGAALQDSGKLDEAIESLKRAIGLNSQSPAAHYNLALAYLKKGDFEHGWPEFEWRADSLISNQQIPKPRWDGSALSGRTILLHAKQGLGDAIQFVRYAPLVKSRGGRVILQCQSELLRLVRGAAGLDQVVANNSALETYDVHSPLLSLPGIFKTRLETIPAEVPYLNAEPNLVKQWSGKIGVPEGKPRIGLAWAGSSRLRQDRNRSLHLNQLGVLAEVPGIEFVSLQKGEAADQISMAPEGMRIIDFSGDLTDLAETAALIANLDLVISVDSAVAHLAGAMGKEVWVFISAMSDWRWMLNRSDSPWYPNMRLFRQKVVGNWNEAVEEVAQALKVRTSG